MEGYYRGYEYRGHGVYRLLFPCNLAITGVHSSLDGYLFRAAMNGCGGLIHSAVVSLEVLLKPVITSLAFENEYCINSAAVFEVEATGSGTLTYQWQMSINGGSTWSSLIDGSEFSGTTTEILTISPVSSFMNGYLLRVIVGGTCAPAAVSAVITLGTRPAPVISLHPASATVCEGSDATFLIEAAGSDLVFEWQRWNGAAWVIVNDADHDISTSANQSVLTVLNVDYILNARQQVQGGGDKQLRQHDLGGGDADSTHRSADLLPPVRQGGLRG
jgi:hypothetical protein